MPYILIIYSESDGSCNDPSPNVGINFFTNIPSVKNAVKKILKDFGQETGDLTEIVQDLIEHGWYPINENTHLKFFKPESNPKKLSYGLPRGDKDAVEKNIEIRQAKQKIEDGEETMCDKLYLSLDFKLSGTKSGYFNSDVYGEDKGMPKTVFQKYCQVLGEIFPDYIFSYFYHDIHCLHLTVEGVEGEISYEKALLDITLDNFPTFQINEKHEGTITDIFLDSPRRYPH